MKIKKKLNKRNITIVKISMLIIMAMVKMVKEKEKIDQRESNKRVLVKHKNLKKLYMKRKNNNLLNLNLKL